MTVRECAFAMNISNEFVSTLINTLLQQGVPSWGRSRNRFNGFVGTQETVETVSRTPRSLRTLLKQGVNGRRSGVRQKPA